MTLLPDDVYAASLNRKATAAGMLFRHEDGRVLMVEPTYKPEWELPGGTGEEGEPPWVTAEREILEEIGLVRTAGPLLAVDYNPAHGVFPESLAFLFDGGPITDDEVAALTLQASEIRSAALLTPPEIAARNPIRAPRIAAALIVAATAGSPALCFSGVPLR